MNKIFAEIMKSVIFRPGVDNKRVCGNGIGVVPEVYQTLETCSSHVSRSYETI